MLGTSKAGPSKQGVTHNLCARMTEQVNHFLGRECLIPSWLFLRWLQRVVVCFEVLEHFPRSDRQVVCWEWKSHLSSVSHCRETKICSVKASTNVVLNVLFSALGVLCWKFPLHILPCMSSSSFLFYSKITFPLHLFLFKYHFVCHLFCVMCYMSFIQTQSSTIARLGVSMLFPIFTFTFNKWRNRWLVHSALSSLQKIVGTT